MEAQHGRQQPQQQPQEVAAQQHLHAQQEQPQQPQDLPVQQQEEVTAQHQDTCTGGEVVTQMNPLWMRSEGGRHRNASNDLDGQLGDGGGGGRGSIGGEGGGESNDGGHAGHIEPFELEAPPAAAPAGGSLRTSAGRCCRHRRCCCSLFLLGWWGVAISALHIGVGGALVMAAFRTIAPCAAMFYDRSSMYRKDHVAVSLCVSLLPHPASPMIPTPTLLPVLSIRNPKPLPRSLT